MADVEKMYRQILLHPSDRDFQRIMWSGEASEPISEYQLTTVTYGLSCAPFLAVRCLLQLAEDEGKNFPLAAEVIKRNTYVDDLLAGEDSEELLREKIEQVDSLFKAGGFQLQKWAANSDSVLEDIPRDRQQKVPKSFETDPVLRALGLIWNPVMDTFSISSHQGVIAEANPTKRSVLSLISELFDPLGWMSPVLTTANVNLQALWTTNLQWDDRLPEHLQSRWKKIVGDLLTAETISIPRWLGTTSASILEVHGFSDASQDSLGAVIYIRVVDECFQAKCSLLIAKTKVAPLKKVTIARLELSAAVLLALLVQRTRSALELSHVPTYLWVDSSVALTWIRGHPSRWKDYVSNRVTLIHDTVPSAKWRHVPGMDNAADLASRGLSPQDLKKADLWWRGPPWLELPSTNWPNQLFYSPYSAYSPARCQS